MHTSVRERPPIRHDDHTDTTSLEFYYLVDSRVGRSTCKAMCEFCWLRRPHLEDFRQEPAEAERIIELMRAQGHRVSPMVSDTFAEEGLYLRSGLFRNSRDPLEGVDLEGPNLSGGFYGSGLGNAAWSSGRPLLGERCNEYLQLCVDNNLRSIVMTSHGTEDRERSFRGLTQPSVVRDAIERIRAFSAETGWWFQIMLTFTVNRTTRSTEDILEYLEYCSELGVDVARFNRFADIQGDHGELCMSPEETEEAYRNLKAAYFAGPEDVQMSVAEDFGSSGVEVMGFPKGVGTCVAGERLFGIVYPHIYVCPVNLTIVAGTLDSDGRIHWNDEVRQRLLEAKRHEKMGGCIGVAYPHHSEIRRFFDGVEQHGLSQQVP